MGHEKKEMISVPETLLQDLLWNVELNWAGEEPASEMEKAIIRQAEELQGYLIPEDYVDPNEGFSFDVFDNVKFVNFRKHTSS